MANKTATILVRLEPEIKRQADQIFARMGMTASSATNVFMHQVVQEGGLPFRPQVAKKPGIPDMNKLSDEEIKELLDESMRNIKAGDTRPFDEVVAEMEAKFGFRL